MLILDDLPSLVKKNKPDELCVQKTRQTRLHQAGIRNDGPGCGRAKLVRIRESVEKKTGRGRNWMWSELGEECTRCGIGTVTWFWREQCVERTVR